uniref:Pentapeptide repeat-containing protein n=1 Tax=Thermogemmatispora argillosa TaxID=2045280 RepID=A0A455SYJ9_9CHLR|nr:hypothetical protein KTA_16260 [Thermogemmatispora argillosa]
MNRPLPAEVSARLQAHQLWRSSSGSAGQRYRATGLDLHALDLSGSSLQEAILRSCSFSSCQLAHADLSGAVLTGSLFQQVHAPAASLSQAICWQTLWLGASLPHLQAERADFSEADLSQADLSASSLRLARFDQARLLGTSFRQANLQQASFFQADLTGADLTGARLWGASFFGATGLESVRADWLDLSPPEEEPKDLLGEPILHWPEWFEISLLEPDWEFLQEELWNSRNEFGFDRLAGEAARRWLLKLASQSFVLYLQQRLQEHEHWLTDGRRQQRLVDGGVDLHGLDLSARRLSHAYLPASNFNHSTLHRTQLACAYLVSCSFLHANLDQANLRWALCWKGRFQQARLRHLDASHASFWLANLQGADLSSAHLAQTDFSDAELSQACFAHANLQQACFAHANLTGADLTGARLWNTSFSGATGLESVRVDWLDVGPPAHSERLTGEAARRWLLEVATAPPS